MWINFEVKEIDGYLLPHPQSTKLSDVKDETFTYHVVLDTAPESFWGLEKEGDEIPEAERRLIPYLKIWSGEINLPSWEFVLSKYELNEFPFIPFDNSFMNSWMKNRTRRDKIDARLESEFTHATELKIIRKALKAIIVAIPELETIPEVQAFKGYSDRIEQHISKFSK